MQIEAARVRPGDHMHGAEVLWVLPVQQQGTVVIALDALVPDSGGNASRLHRYAAEAVIEVDDAPARRPASASG
jgi:hypothetical protein